MAAPNKLPRTRLRKPTKVSCRCWDTEIGVLCTRPAKFAVGLRGVRTSFPLPCCVLHVRPYKQHKGARYTVLPL
jgi:hypothetical protein